MTCLYWDSCSELSLQEAEPVLTLFDNCDAIRRPERFQFFLTACKAIRKASEENEAHIDLRHKTLLHLLNLCQKIDSSVLRDAGYEKEEFGIQLRLLRLKTIENYLQELNNES